MKRTIAIAALSFALMSSQALADEHRGGDAALGALSGAVVFGPIGAIAGAAVGYAAGPSIARSWGFRRSHSAARHARTVRAAPAAPDTRPAVQSGPSVQQAPPPAPSASRAQSAPPPTPRTASTLPPVQTLE